MVVVDRSRGSAPPPVDAAVAGAGDPPLPSVPAGPSGDPLRVRIPAIGLVAPLVRLGLNADRTLEVPTYVKARVVLLIQGQVGHALQD